jgi:hypothetical protein
MRRWDLMQFLGCRGGGVSPRVSHFSFRGRVLCVGEWVCPGPVCVGCVCFCFSFYHWKFITFTKVRGLFNEPPGASPPWVWQVLRQTTDMGVFVNASNASLEDKDLENTVNTSFTHKNTQFLITVYPVVCKFTAHFLTFWLLWFLDSESKHRHTAMADRSFISCFWLVFFVIF